MGRAEAYALSNPPIASFIDGFSSGLGYSFILLTISIFRELLGMGTIFNITILPDSFTKWTLMVMAPGGFLLLAIIIWLFKAFFLKEEVKK